MAYELKDLEEQYELELEKVVAVIKKKEAKIVLLQLPDGLKPWAMTIVDYLHEKTSVQINIWLGDCFGACDQPTTSADLVIQFGHAPWDNTSGKSISSVQ